jgi:hypothetical protein
MPLQARLGPFARFGVPLSAAHRPRRGTSISVADYGQNWRFIWDVREGTNHCRLIGGGHGSPDFILSGPIIRDSMKALHFLGWPKKCESTFPSVANRFREVSNKSRIDLIVTVATVVRQNHPYF